MFLSTFISPFYISYIDVGDAVQKLYVVIDRSVYWPFSFMP